MLIILAVLLAIVGIIGIVFRNLNQEIDEQNIKIKAYNESKADRFYHKELKTRLPFQLENKKAYMLFGGALFLMFVSIANPIGYNTYGYRQCVEDPIFGTRVQFEQGAYYKGFFSTEIPYPNVVTIVHAKTENIPTDEVSFIGPPVEIRFSDAAKATAEDVVKWRLPNNEEKMLLIHADNRTADKLTETVLEPYSAECLGYAAQLMESETHYSGGKSKMAEDYQSQLEEGQYIIEQKTEYAGPIDNQRKITTTEIRRDTVTNIPIRRKSNLIQYGITVAGAAIKSVDYDDMIDEKLKAKIEASTTESISKQTAITAAQQAITAVKEGEKLIAEKKAEQEAIEQEAIIIARKERKVAEENLIRDKALAEATLVRKKAEAEGDRLKVQAGLSPLEEANIEKETRIGMMKALADGIGNAKWPSVMSFGGGKEGTATNPLEAVGFKMMWELAEKAAQSK